MISTSVQQLIDLGVWEPGEGCRSHLRRVRGNPTFLVHVPDPTDKRERKTGDDFFAHDAVRSLHHEKALGDQSLAMVSGSIKVSSHALHALNDFLVAVTHATRKRPVDKAWARYLDDLATISASFGPVALTPAELEERAELISEQQRAAQLEFSAWLRRWSFRHAVRLQPQISRDAHPALPGEKAARGQFCGSGRHLHERRG